ncbi:MAG: hypothetical protein RLO17_02130 [Cyclobacteriaceae bacterium]
MNKTSVYTLTSGFIISSISVIIIFDGDPNNIAGFLGTFLVPFSFSIIIPGMLAMIIRRNGRFRNELFYKMSWILQGLIVLGTLGTMYS